VKLIEGKLTKGKAGQAMQREFGKNRRIWNLHQNELFVLLAPPEQGKLEQEGRDHTKTG
jgi:hypothetical protein